jgi:glutamate formiminotransferase/formiminotetrahydrofolate cyclodeaminase
MSGVKIVECVPNFSEGRDLAVVNQIVDAIKAVDGVKVLDVDPGEATNRTVVTMVGAPEVVVEAAFAGISMAAKVIDMSKQSGAHPRMGATDVCPFVPVQGVTMEECAALAGALGARVASELGIPVYLYEHAASSPARENLAKVRSGEYEGLSAKLVDPEWAPDFGAAAYTDTVERSGATIIGARPFLIAYNVNLNTKNVKKAMKIAALVREKGIIVRDASGEIVRDAEEKAVRKPGLFKCVKAIGWYIEEYDRCQVSINFTNYKTSSLHEVVDAIRRVADQEGVVVTGSELVGLVPLDAMTAAGQYYLERQGVNPGATERELVEVAIRSLGLRDLGPFDPEQAIVERRLGGDGRLVAMTGRTFIDTLSSIAPAPGGGSVAALCGAMGTALAAMVGQLSTGKKGYAERDADWRDMAVGAQALKEAFLADVDADTAAFDGIMAGFGMPKSTREEKIARRTAIQSATQVAIEVPLRVLERSVDATGLLRVAAEGNANARSDAGVGALVVRAAAEGAWYNVTINLKGFKNETLSASFRSRADVALAKVTDACDEITAEIRRHLG